MKHLFIILLISITFFNCDPGVEINNIDTNNLISVSCFISPQDSLLTAFLYKAGAIGTIAKSDCLLVKDAIVVISGLSGSDTLYYNEGTKRYSAKREMAIEALKSYNLWIQTPEGVTLQSSCTIPPTPSLPGVSGEIHDDDFHFEIEWNNPSQHRYFTVTSFAEGIYEYEFPFGTRKQQLTAAFYDNPRFPSDAQNEQNSLGGIVSFATLADDPKLTITLSNIEEDLFEYFKTYREADDWDANNSGNLFPNFQEPQIIYSNIDGGVGIFAGYNSSKSTISLN